MCLDYCMRNCKWVSGTDYLDMKLIGLSDQQLIVDGFIIILGKVHKMQVNNHGFLTKSEIF